MAWSFQANLTHSLISTQVATPKETAPPPPTPAQVKQERKELLGRVRAVLEASGCDVDKARKAGKNMVFVAAECGNVEALEMLVSAGAKIDAPATTGETPTHVAQAKGHAAAHAWLVARGGVEGARSFMRDEARNYEFAVAVGACVQINQ